METTLSEIKDKVARQSYGCDHWDDFYAGNKEYPKELSQAFEEVADLYADTKLQEAAEDLKEEIKVLNIERQLTPYSLKVLSYYVDKYINK